MSDTIRQPIPQTGSITPNEATFLGGILRKGDFIGGWAIESKIPVNSGEAELYMAKKDGHTGVIKYYRSPDFKPKDEIVKTLLSWKHEDVIQLLDTGRHNNLFFEAMEYAAGGAIDSRDASGYRYLPLSEEETAQMVREVSNAFKACHEAGIIHRDIKPANIFYRNEDGSDFVIGDFGISSQLDMEARLSSRLTQNLNRTEGYAAPEVYSGVIKGPVDYYALGITVWEVMTGTVAFEGRNPNHVSRDTIEGRIIDDLLSRDESADFSDKMKTLLKGLLTHKHDKRWGYEQVQDWLDGKDVPVYSQRPEIKVPPYKFEGQELTSLAKVAEALLVSPEAGKKALFRGVIEGWLAAFDQDLAMKVGDIKENLGETAKDKALRQVALTLNPGQPFVTAGGKAIESFFEFAKVIQTEPEELVEHLRNPDDGLWDFFEIWGAGAIIEALKPMLGSVKSQKRLVNMMVVALKGNVI
ncbi:MAG: protein kinase domain-containing protein, partial [Rectinemataceae bacterium]